MSTKTSVLGRKRKKFIPRKNKAMEIMLIYVDLRDISDGLKESGNFNAGSEINFMKLSSLVH